MATQTSYTTATNAAWMYTLLAAAIMAAIAVVVVWAYAS